MIDFNDAYLLKYSPRSRNAYEELVEKYNKAKTSSWSYGEILFVDGYFYNSGWQQNTILQAGEAYCISDTTEYYQKTGIEKKHYHTTNKWGSFKTSEYIYKGNEFNHAFEKSSSSPIATSWNDQAYSYMYYKHSGININKAYIDKSIDFYEYVGGNFFQDPYTLEYSGEPSPEYFEHLKITKEKWEQDTLKEINRYASGRDTYSKELRPGIEQLKYDMKMCELKVIPVIHSKEWSDRPDEYQYIENRVMFGEQLLVQQSINKYYMIENSVRWRNEMNFTPNKEFAPKVSYSDNGAYQLDPSNLSVYQSSDYWSD